MSRATMLASPLRTELRRLRRRPLLAATVIATAALSIAAATTLATAVRHFVLRPLPGVAAPSELVNLHRADARDPFGSFSLAEYRAVAERLAALDGVAAFRDQGVSFAVGDEPTLAVAQIVSGNYFATLGARPAAGRLLAGDDDRAGAPPVVVLDHALWQRRFGGDPAIVGRSVRLNGRSFEVVGVGPPEFVGTFLGFRFELYVPLAQIALADPSFDAARPAQHRLELVARRRAGVPLERAREELAATAEAFRRDSPERWRDAAFALAATSGVEPSLEAAAELFFTALGALGALALAVVAVNVAGLLLADLIDRRHELAVRAALGAGRRRLLAPLVAQSTLLFGAGGALGVALSLAASRALAAWSTRLAIPVDLALRPDLKVLGFGLGLALALGASIGAAAAWRASQAQPAEAMAGARGVAGGHRRQPRAVLVATQVL
ncbi:MAG: ABC transporter permease, partial [Thermoanaerobaculia bacterium]|nr:ABC transporter permease [Thermoanaerobaculia bacterium]